MPPSRNSPLMIREHAAFNASSESPSITTPASCVDAPSVCGIGSSRVSRNVSRARKTTSTPSSFPYPRPLADVSA
ncbi:hypothetical protein ADM96_15960 [Burkholderia sp. ST111]|nr:hypothetical protein ADM96_15960 [Burkholderia sp. ST111]